MAIAMHKTSNYGFLTNLGPAVEQYSKYLTEELGATMEIQFQAIKISYPGAGSWLHPLPINSTAIIKGLIPEDVKAQLVKGVFEFIAGASNKIASHKGVKFTPPSEIWSIGVDFGGADELKKTLHFNQDGTVTANHIAETAPVNPAAKIVTPESPEKVIEAIKKKNPAMIIQAAKELEVKKFVGNGPVVALKDATMLNQPTHGSSHNSVYRVIGIGERIRLSARLQGGTLSVRVEGMLTPEEKAAFTELSLTDHGKYMSAHFNLGGIPAERVLGCIFFHESLKFISKITSMKDLTT